MGTWVQLSKSVHLICINLMDLTKEKTETNTGKPNFAEDFYSFLIIKRSLNHTGYILKSPYTPKVEAYIWV